VEITGMDQEKTAAAPRQLRRWHIYHDPRDLVRHAQRAVVGAATEATARRGRFDLVISGGPVLQRLFRHFRERRVGDDRWHIWFSDEYCLPPGHPGRNESVAGHVWLEHSGVPAGNIHGMPCEAAPEDAAGRYLESLAQVATFDLVVLAMGADGHTAALFPGHGLAEFEDAPDALAVHAPEPPHGRVTLSACRLSRTRQLVLLVSGEGKRHAVSRWRSGQADLPVGRLRPEHGIDVFADEGAIPGF